jgi:hypothetical protein
MVRREVSKGFVFRMQYILCTQNYYEGFFEKIKNEGDVFWVVAPCSLVEVNQHFKGAFCLHHQGDHPHVEAASTSETSVTWRNNPEDSHLHTRCHESLKSHIIKNDSCLWKF